MVCSPALMPSQRNGSASHGRDRLVHPRQPGQVAVGAQDQVREGAPGQVGGGHPVADVTRRPSRDRCARSRPAEAHQSLRCPAARPGVRDLSHPEGGEQFASVRRSAANTAGTRSNDGRTAEPRW